MPECECVGTYAKQNKENAVTVKRISGIYTKKKFAGKYSSCDGLLSKDKEISF